MKRNDWIFLLTVALYSFLFWQQRPGFNVLLFGGAVVVGTALFDFGRLKHRGWWLSALGVLVTGAGVYLNGSLLALFGYSASLLLLATQCLHPGASVLASWLVSVSSVAGSFVFMITDSVERRNTALEAEAAGEGSGRKRTPGRMWAVIISIVVVVVFFLLYRQSNVLFKELTKHINLDFISLGWLLFTAIGACVIYGIYYLHGPRDLAESSRRIRRNLDPSTDGMPRWGDSLLSLDNERFIGVLLFALLNVLTFFVIGGDILFQLGGQQLPDGVTFTSYVHQGVGGLIISIVLAMALVLFFFRGRLNFDQRFNTLRALAILWLVQNVLMLVFTGMRNNMYSLEYGLTYKRLGVYFYLLVTLGGLLSTAVKVMNRKTNSWLFNANTWLCYAVLAGSTLVSWDRFITYYNLTYPKSLDKAYLSNLTGANVDLLAKLNMKSAGANKKLQSGTFDDDDNVDFNGLLDALYKRNWTGNENFSMRLHTRVYRHLYGDRTIDWRSHVYLGHHVAQELRAMPRFGPDTFLVISRQQLKTLYYFNGFSAMTQVDASDNELRDAGEVARFPNLKALNLSGNPLTSLRGLEGCRKLDQLELCDVPQMDYHELKRLPMLTRVIVSSDEQVAAVKRVRPDVTIIQK